MTSLSAAAVSVSLGDARILAEVDLDISGGEVVGLIGPNGAGKTTLLRAMAGLLPLDAGEIRLDGRAVQQVDRKKLARSVAYLPQGGESHWAVSVETLVMLGRLPHLGAWRGPTDEDRSAVTRALEACDIVRFKDRPMTHLSGGERARVLLARTLAVEPKVLLADEPVAGLDPAHQLDVMERLRALAANDCAVVVVMHDLTLAARFCERLALLYDKRVFAEGRADAVLSPDNLARCYGIRAHLGSASGVAVVVPLERIDGGADYVST